VGSNPTLSAILYFGGMTEINNSKIKVGLALGSGAARGIAHIGVLKALKEAQIPVDYVAGTSMGSLVGACYAADADISMLEEIALTSNLRNLTGLLDPKFFIFRVGMLKGGRVEKFLKTIIGDIDISQCVIPYSAVATDIKTGNEVVINTGPLIKAVRASISIPAVFIPVHYKGLYLVDGGTVNPVPADVVRAMGANFIIAVNVLNDPRKRKRLGLTGDKKSDKMPSMFNTIIQSIYIMEYGIVRANLLKADILIEPDVSAIEPYEFYRGGEAIEAGYQAAKIVVPEIEKLLNSFESV
jgi:NTE family protein